MEYKKFKEKLVVAGLTVKEFSQKANINYSTINNWTGSTTQPWVESWLDLYIKNQNLQRLKDLAIEIAKEDK